MDPNERDRPVPPGAGMREGMARVKEELAAAPPDPAGPFGLLECFTPLAPGMNPLATGVQRALTDPAVRDKARDAGPAGGFSRGVSSARITPAMLGFPPAGSADEPGYEIEEEGRGG